MMSRMRSPLAQNLLALCVILFALALKFLLMLKATPNSDASYYLNIASNYLTRGGLTPYMWRLDLDTNIIAGSGTGYGVLIMIAWLGQFGLTLLSGRILMYLAGLLTLFALYSAAMTHWQDRRTAMWVLVFTSVNVMFFYTFVLRMDALGILAYTLVLWLHFYASQRGYRWLHGLVGILAVALAEVHIIGTVYLGMYAIYYGIEQVQLWWRERRIGVSEGAIEFFIAAFIAGCVYLWVHVLPDPEAYFHISQACSFCIPRGLEKEARRFLEYFTLAPLETVAFVAAIIWMLRHQAEENRHVLSLMLGALIAYFIISPPTSLQYTAHLYPLASLIIGTWFANTTSPLSLMKRLVWLIAIPLLILVGSGTFPEVIHLFGVFLVGILINTTVRYLNLAPGLPVLLVVGLLIIRIGDTWTGLPRYGYVPANPIGEPVRRYIHEHIPQDTVIMGAPQSYLVLLNYPNYISYDDGEEYGIVLRDETYATFFARHAPSVILDDTGVFDRVMVANDPILQRYMSSAGGFQEVMDGLWVSETIIEQLNLPIEP